MANSANTPTPTHISEMSPDKGSTQSRQSSSRELKINDNFWAQQLTSSETQDSKITYQRLDETTTPFRSCLQTIKHGGQDFIRVIGGGGDVGDNDGGKGNFC